MQLSYHYPKGYHDIGSFPVPSLVRNAKGDGRPCENSLVKEDFSLFWGENIEIYTGC